MILLKPEHITRADSRPYLFRLTVLKTAWFAVFLHKFFDSDDPCQHDHPWPYVSIILWGGYWEVTPCGGIANQAKALNAGELHHADGGKVSRSRPASVIGMVRRRWYWPGSVLVRPAAWVHSIEIDPKQRFRPVTLVLAGKKGRDWGFLTRHGWIPHYRYSHAQHCD